MLNRMFLLMLLSSFAWQSYAQTGQYPAYLMIANGGQFESTPPFVDYVTPAKCMINIGDDCNYEVFDTIYTQSVQDAFQVDNGNLYIAAENKLVAYDENFHRINAVDFPESYGSFKDLFWAENLLFAGKWFGADATFLYVYDENLNLSYSVPEITKPVEDLLVKDGIAYISQNTKGTIDACPPYGCFSDSLGYVAKVDAATGNFLGNIDFNTDGAGTSFLYADDDYLYSLNKVAESISYYNFNTEQIDHYPVAGLERGIEINENIIYLLAQGDVVSYNVSTQQIEETNLVPGIQNFVTEAVYDSIENRFFIAETDYATYGKVRIAQNGVQIDSIEVGISPEALTIQYKYENVGIKNQVEILLNEVYPNPVNEVLYFQSDYTDSTIDLYNSVGGHIQKNVKLINNTLNVESLSPGVYYLRINQDGSNAIIQFVKAS